MTELASYPWHQTLLKGALQPSIRNSECQRNGRRRCHFHGLVICLLRLLMASVGRTRKNNMRRAGRDLQCRRCWNMLKHVLNLRDLYPQLRQLTFQFFNFTLLCCKFLTAQDLQRTLFFSWGRTPLTKKRGNGQIQTLPSSPPAMHQQMLRLRSGRLAWKKNDLPRHQSTQRTFLRRFLRQCRARISKDWKMIDWLRNLVI